MIILKDIVKDLDFRVLCGSADIAVDSIAYDSRKVSAGSLFVCVRGFVSDGHRYISQALEQGACAILIQDDQKTVPMAKLIEIASEKNAAVLSVLDTRRGLAQVSAAFFSYPSDKIMLLGITGTKGKTTTTYMIRDIFESAKKTTGLIGTVSNIIGGETRQADRTTPESYDLQALLSEMAEKKLDACVMEVSSQGLMLDRSYGCRFYAGAFTNLYHDHIGEHEHANMEEYLEAKLRIFDQSEIAIINADSDVAEKTTAYAGSRCRVYTYGIENSCDVRAVQIRKESQSGKIGTSFDLISPWYNESLFVAMPGKFNVYNALCAVTFAGVCRIPFEAVKSGLAGVCVPGRLQMVPHKGNFTVLVDYAHNAASLQNLLETLREYCTGRLITLFGCGGDRAKSRRYEMGEVSGRLSDLTIITSDNPRSEDPMEIILDILKGFSKPDIKYLVEPDRKSAISLALSLAREHDFVIIAGKGHENYQIFKDRTIHFDDAETAAGLLRDIKNSLQ